jgi:hypothetical protein
MKYINFNIKAICTRRALDQFLHIKTFQDYLSAFLYVNFIR